MVPGMTTVNSESMLGSIRYGNGDVYQKCCTHPSLPGAEVHRDDDAENCQTPMDTVAREVPDERAGERGERQPVDDVVDALECERLSVEKRR